MAARPQPRPARRLRLDIMAVLLAPLGVGVVLLAQKIEGIPLSALAQGPAALIVLGGTLGAVLVSHSVADVVGACRAACRSFLEPTDDSEALSASLISLAIRAHRRGVLAVESDLESIKDPFLKEGLSQILDETPLELLRDSLKLANDVRVAEEEAPARIFDAAAGYSPTLGILGAVLGLIRVMQSLAAPGALGGGIAVAFVATIYGVGAANLILLPLAARLRERAASEGRRREMMIAAICAIHQRVHPRIVAQRLRAFSSKVPRIEDVTARMPRTAIRESRLPA